jgi:hypothetical protein
LTNKKMSFAVENISLVDNAELDRSQFSLLKVDTFSTERSAHDTFVSPETLRKTAKSILLKPFVFFTDERWDDAGGHDKREVPGGFVPHNSLIEFKETSSGHLMLSVEVLVWKRYSSKLLDYFKRDGNRKGVSVEVEIFDAVEDPKTGLVELIDFCYNAITCLGDVIRPAIPNAQAVLQFSEEFKKAKDEYVFSSKYGGIDFKIPDYVKDAAQKALDNYRENGGKQSSVALASARYITKNESMTPERMRHLHRMLHRGNALDDPNLDLYGGKEAREWSHEIVQKMNEIDDKEMLYLDDGGSIVENKVDEENISEEKSELEKEEMSVATDNYLALETIEKEEENNMAKEKEMAKEEEEVKDEKMAEEEKPEEKMAEEKKEDEKDEEKEDNEVSMSLDQTLDVSALLEFLKNETKAYSEAGEESDKEIAFAINAALGEISKGRDADVKIVTNAMLAYMTKTSARNADLRSKNLEFSTDNKGLREYKREVEAKQKSYEVETVLKEAYDAGMPEEELDACRNEAVNFSLGEIDSYKNMVKAKAFKYFGKKKSNNNGVVRIGLPFTEPKYKEPTLWK